jgi:comEA protein
MKGKRAETIVIVLSLLLAAFAGGYFTGRNAVSGGGTSVYTQLPIPLEETTPGNNQNSETQEEPALPDDSSVIPLTGQPSEESKETSNAENPQEGKININTADVDELMTLPGIGQVIAQRIVDFREEYGPFSTVEELLDVSGIGEKKLDAIKDLVYVGD